MKRKRRQTKANQDIINQLENRKRILWLANRDAVEDLGEVYSTLGWLDELFRSFFYQEHLFPKSSTEGLASLCTLLQERVGKVSRGLQSAETTKE